MLHSLPTATITVTYNDRTLEVTGVELKKADLSKMPPDWREDIVTMQTMLLEFLVKRNSRDNRRHARAKHRLRNRLSQRFEDFLSGQRIIIRRQCFAITLWFLYDDEALTWHTFMIPSSTRLPTALWRNIGVAIQPLLDELREWAAAQTDPIQAAEP